MKSKKGFGRIVSIVAWGGLMLCCVVVFLGTKTSPQTKTTVSNNESTQAPKPTEISLSPTCQQIKAETDAITELQWEAYKSEIENKWVIDWQGTVSQVGDAGLFTEEYPIHIEIESDCRIYASVSDKNLAMSFGIGDSVSVSGRIYLLADLLGKVIYIDNVLIEKK